MSFDVAEINKIYKDKSPADLIAWALEQAGDESVIVSTNFRPLEAVILDFCTKAKADMDVVWADSGFMMEETYVFAEKAIEQLKLNVSIYTPLVTRARREALHGLVTPGLDDEEALEAFAEEVKLEPFRRALGEKKPKVWFTSLRKEQNPFRDTLDLVAVEGGMIKVNPLFYWTEEQMEQYITDNNLPDEKIYFDPTKISEKRECGLHKPTFSK